MTTRNMLIIAGAVVLALAAVVTAVVVTIGGPVGGEQPRPVIPSAQSEEGEASPYEVPQQLNMVVFFQSPVRPDLLVPVGRSVFNTIALDQQADQLMQKLIQGPTPSEGLLPTVPEGTRLQRLYLAGDGTAFVAFNLALIENHRGGVAGEMMTVYSIVDTLCVNFPSIRRVQILIEGADPETLAGHIDITQPLEINEDLFALPQTTETEAAEEPEGVAQ